MAKELDKREEQLITEFLAGQSVLVLDLQGTSRMSITKIIVGLGVKTNKVIGCPDFVTAQEDFSKSKPKIALCDYNLGAKTGLDFLKVFREAHGLAYDTLFFMILSDPSQTAKLQAHEDEISAYVTKPYTVDSFREVFCKTILQFIAPTTYQKIIQQGRLQYQHSKLEEAWKLFNVATTQDPKPLQAYVFRGLIELKQNKYPEAEESLKKALSISEKHYRSLSALHELYMETKNHEKTFEISKILAREYGHDQHHLVQALRLLIQAKRFQDVDDLFECYKKTEGKTPELNRTMSATFVVTAKNYLQLKETKKGMEYLRKAAQISDKYPNILKEIVILQIDHQNFDDADLSLKNFSTEDQEKKEYQIAFLYYEDRQRNDARYSVYRSNQVIQKGIEEPLVYEINIKRLLEIQKREDAEDRIVQAVKKWPEKKEVFENFRNLKFDPPPVPVTPAEVKAEEKGKKKKAEDGLGW